MDKILVYGTLNEGLVFAPKENALAQAQKWKAIKTAKTWQDFIDLTSQETFESVIYEILEYLDYEQLYPNYLMGEDLSNYISDLVLPQPEDPFSTDLLPEFDEGEYMPILAQEMMAWIPVDLQEEMGEIVRDEAKSFYYKIDPENENLAIKSFEILGYEIEKNQKLIENAEGIF